MPVTVSAPNRWSLPWATRRYLWPRGRFAPHPLGLADGEAGATMSAAPPRVVINAVRPSTPDRVSAAKATVGHQMVFSANVFADGHDLLAGRVRWRALDGTWIEFPLSELGNDRFAAPLVPAQVGAHEYVVEGWIDDHATWRHRIAAKLAAGQDVTPELEEGARLLEGERDRLPPTLSADADRLIARLRDTSRDPVERAEPALSGPVATAVSRLPHRTQTTTSGPW